MKISGTGFSCCVLSEAETARRRRSSGMRDLLGALLGHDGRDPQKIQKAFRRALGLLTSPEQIQRHLVGTVVEVFQANRVALFDLDADDNVFVPTIIHGDKPSKTSAFSFEDALPRWMNVNRRHLHLARDERVLARCDSAERAKWEVWDFGWLFPLMSLNRLNGFLALGHQDLNAEDIELVRVLVNLGGVALHNASLHRKQIAVEESFHRAEKVALAGQLAAAAAHEIRNPLTSIRSTVQYVHGTLEREDRRHAMMADVLEEVDRINGIVEGLLASVRPKAPAVRRVALTDLLEKIVAPVEREGKFDVVTRFDDNCHEAICDPEQVRQVVLNLVQNAQQAMGDTGTLTLETRLEGATSDAIRQVSPSQYRIVVADDGPGMSESVRRRIFDPFYTTKGAGGGTGLGLSICRGIIEKHGGEIGCESAPGEGARFEIRLPVVQL